MAAPPPEGIEVHEDAPLARHTYLRIGGPARYLAIPDNVDQLQQLFAWARAESLSVRVLGGGSNLLVADEGIDALVVSLRRAAGSFQFVGERVVAGAAVMLPALSRAAAGRGLGGLEFAIGIEFAIRAPSAGRSTATPASATAARSARSSRRSRCWAAPGARRFRAASCTSPIAAPRYEERG